MSRNPTFSVNYRDMERYHAGTMVKVMFDITRGSIKNKLKGSQWKIAFAKGRNIVRVYDELGNAVDYKDRDILPNGNDKTKLTN